MDLDFADLEGGGGGGSTAPRPAAVPLSPSRAITQTVVHSSARAGDDIDLQALYAVSAPYAEFMPPELYITAKEQTLMAKLALEMARAGGSDAPGASKPDDTRDRQSIMEDIRGLKEQVAQCCLTCGAADGLLARCWSVGRRFVSSGKRDAVGGAGHDRCHGHHGGLLFC